MKKNKKCKFSYIVKEKYAHVFFKYMTNILVISQSFRKTFITIRNRKLNLLKHVTYNEKILNIKVKCTGLVFQNYFKVHKLSMVV